MMKKIIPLLFILSSSLFIAPAQAQWVQIVDTSARLYPHATMGKIIYAGIIPGMIGFGVSLSTDNGTTWQWRDTKGFDALDVAVSGNILYAGNEDFGTDGDVGIYRSLDSGVTWEFMDNLFWGNLFDNMADQVGIDPVGAQGSLVIGQGYQGVYRSLDNGMSWGATDGSLINNVNTFTFHNNYIFAGTRNGVYRSTDSGYSWIQVNTGMMAMSTSCLLVQNNMVYAGGGSKDSRYYPDQPAFKGLYRSDNDGESWSLVFSALDSNYVTSLGAIGNNIFAGTDSGGIFLSTDNGANWRNVNDSLLYLPVYEITINGSYVFFSDNYGIWRRPLSDFGISAVNEKPNDLPAQFSLQQNYPNPFSANTNVEYRIPNEEHVTLSIYNSLGEEVATLVNSESSAGTHSVQLSGEGLQNGIYFYRLTAGRDVQTGKMAVIH